MYIQFTVTRKQGSNNSSQSDKTNAVHLESCTKICRKHPECNM